MGPAGLGGRVAVITGRASGAEAAALDVRDLAAFEALARDVRDRHGRIDLRPCVGALPGRRAHADPDGPPHARVRKDLV
jgi:hypothetical protein